MNHEIGEEIVFTQDFVAETHFGQTKVITSGTKAKITGKNKFGQFIYRITTRKHKGTMGLIGKRTEE